MAYRLKPSNIKAKAIRAIAREQVMRAVAVLSQDPVPPTGVHEARKVVKRLRSLLRLLDPTLRNKELAALYKAIGGLGDQLAGARGAHVLRETVDKLEAHFGSNANATLAPLKSMFACEVEGHAPHLDAARAKRVIDGFARQRRKLDKLKVKRTGFACIVGGLEGTYRKARRAFAHAYSKPEDELFHELRKAVQWHQRHMALLSRAWPEFFNMRIAACRELAELLGDDHDLSELIDLVERRGDDTLDTSRIVALARNRQAELRSAARALSERLFAERPAAFARRMECYWNAAPLISSIPRTQPDTRMVTPLKIGSDETGSAARPKAQSDAGAPRLAAKAPK
ncbi:MAG: CHAD domain-containing protein [Hyphomicrobium sp.]